MKPGFHAALRAANGIDWANRQLAFVVRWGLLANALLIAGNAILVVFPGIAITQQVQVQATDQEIENALRPVPAEPSPEPEFSEQEKK